MADKCRWQLWLRGNRLIGHVSGCSKEEAMNELRRQAKDEFGYKRLPEGSCVCLIEPDYYEKIAESNRRQGFGLQAGD